MKKITFLILTMLLTITTWRTSAQWSENFDASTTLPTGWTVINGGGANGWVVTANPSGGAHSGTNVASILYNTAAHDDYLITPAIAVTAGVSDRVSFFIKSRSGSYLEPYEVKLSTTGTSVSNFNVTLQASVEAPNAWTENVFDLTSYVGQTVYIAIHATGTDEWQLFVDDFVNTAIPSCPAPTALNASGFTINSANLSWTSSGSASLWNIEYGTDGFALGGGTVVNGVTNPYTLGSLSSGTSYDYYVQSDCGANGTSAWSGPFSFSTLCDTAALPYFNDFNTDMNCWTVENVNADANVWQLFSNTSPLSCINTASTDLVLGVAYNAALDTDDYAFSPAFQLQAGTNYTLNFSYGNDGGSTYVENMAVYLCSAPTSTSALAGTALYDETDIAGGCQNFFDNSITVPTNGIYYIAFHGYSAADMDILMIDDFSFMETPACPAPTALNLVSKTATSATFGWTAGGSETQWDIEWGPEGFAQGTGTMITGTTNNPYTLNGLTYGTHYSAYVRANCGSGSESTWVGPLTWFYIDLAGCTTVVNPLDAAVDVPLGTVVFEWTPAATGEPATSYNMYYGLTPSTVTNLVGNFTTTSAEITLSDYGVTFYWLISPVNAAGETQGCTVWSFTTEEYVPPVCTVNEYFEGTTIPSGWTSVMNSGTCDFTFGSGEMPTGPSFVSNAAIFDDDACGNNVNNNVTLFSPVYDLTGATNAILNYDVAFQDFAGSGEFIVEVYDGTAWVEVDNYNTTDLTEIVSASHDVLALANANFQVRFTYNDEEDWAWGAGMDNFCINTDAPALGIANETITGFEMYPNPVNNSLNLKALNNIDAISIYNMLGQELLRVNPSSTQVQLDMTQISAGSYVVKVQSGTQIGAYSLIKQ